jgi:hypothetical protein
MHRRRPRLPPQHLRLPRLLHPHLIFLRTQRWLLGPTRRPPMGVRKHLILWRQRIEHHFSRLLCRQPLRIPPTSIRSECTRQQSYCQARNDVKQRARRATQIPR